MTAATPYRYQLRDAVVTALRNANTLAQQRVFAPRDWKLWEGILPAIQVRVPRENKTTDAVGTVPQFTTTSTISVKADVNANTEEDAEALLEQISTQIEAAILCDPVIPTLIQRFSSVDTASGVKADGKFHLGTVVVNFAMEFYEVFEPNVGGPLEGINIHADTASPFDANGTYTPSMGQPVAPAPRTSGPDGRDEGALKIDLPQP